MSGTVLKQVQYVYDVFDRRIAQIIDADGNGTFEMTERYSYDGDNIVLVFDSNGNVAGRYLQGPGVDQVLAEENGSSDVSWMLPDHHGGVHGVINGESSPQAFRILE